jgi:hypothetical protein
MGVMDGGMLVGELDWIVASVCLLVYLPICEEKNNNNKLALEARRLVGLSMDGV